jgi:hypothetical protein
VVACDAPSMDSAPSLMQIGASVVGHQRDFPDDQHSFEHIEQRLAVDAVAEHLVPAVKGHWECLA